MKEWLTAFLKSAGHKLLILGSIALVVAAVLFIASRPVIREPIAETIRREGSAFTVDGLGAGTTREDVIAWMDARHYTWTEGQKREYVEGTYYDELFRDLEGVTWISLAEETRVSELGSASVRRHYYFRDGLVTHIDLEMDPTKKSPAEGVRRTEAVTKALEAAWDAPTSADELQRLLEDYGETYTVWEDRDGGVDVIARRWAVTDRLSDRGKDPSTVPHTDYYSLVIRVRMGEHPAA